MKEKPKDNSIRFHYCNEHDRLCITCPDCVESARKESFENGRIVGFEVGLIDELVEKRVEKARKEGADKANEKVKEILASLDDKMRTCGYVVNWVTPLIATAEYRKGQFSVFDWIVRELRKQSITLEKKEVK